MKRSLALFAVVLLLLIPGMLPNINVASTRSVNFALTTSVANAIPINTLFTTTSPTEASAPTFELAGMNVTISPGGNAIAYNYFQDCCGTGNGYCCGFYFYGLLHHWW